MGCSWWTRRLKELVKEAEANGLKVIVFSCFPDVEARAIGGAYGAGRTGTVRVHRLLAPGTVDEWVGEGSG